MNDSEMLVVARKTIEDMGRALRPGRAMMDPAFIERAKPYEMTEWQMLIPVTVEVDGKEVSTPGGYSTRLFRQVDAGRFVCNIVLLDFEDIRRDDLTALIEGKIDACKASMDDMWERETRRDDA